MDFGQRFAATRYLTLRNSVIVVTDQNAWFFASPYIQVVTSQTDIDSSKKHFPDYFDFFSLT